jgi:hypothetical protein
MKKGTMQDALQLNEDNPNTWSIMESILTMQVLKFWKMEPGGMIGRENTMGKECEKDFAEVNKHRRETWEDMT